MSDDGCVPYEPDEYYPDTERFYNSVDSSKTVIDYVKEFDNVNRLVRGGTVVNGKRV